MVHASANPVNDSGIDTVAPLACVMVKRVWAWGSVRRSAAAISSETRPSAAQKVSRQALSVKPIEVSPADQIIGIVVMMFTAKLD